MSISERVSERYPSTRRYWTFFFSSYSQEDALEIPNAFVVGSGLDHDGLGRNLRGIYRITEN